jgi:hypothetical protein
VNSSLCGIMRASFLIERPSQVHGYAGMYPEFAFEIANYAIPAPLQHVHGQTESIRLHVMYSVSKLSDTGSSNSAVFTRGVKFVKYAFTIERPCSPITWTPEHSVPSRGSLLIRETAPSCLSTSAGQAVYKYCSNPRGCPPLFLFNSQPSVFDSWLPTLPYLPLLNHGTQLSKTAHMPDKDGSVHMFALSGTNPDRSQSCPSDPQQRPIQEMQGTQETLDELRQLLSRIINSNEHSMKSVLDFCARTAAWNQWILEQQKLVEKLRCELEAAKHNLANSEIALQRERESSDALRQAVAAETQRSDGLRFDLGIHSRSVQTFVEINAKLSNAVCNLTTLGGVEV